MNCKETQLVGTRDITAIRSVAEQQFFMFVTERIPDAKIVHEPIEFSIKDDDGNTNSTVPDFYIERSSSEGIVVEITTASKKDNSDPKLKQKHVMRHFPAVRYTVLYRENLMAIQAKHPEVSFFQAKMIRRK